jgi:hypothetical protein
MIMNRYIAFIFLAGIANVGCCETKIKLDALSDCVEILSAKEKSFHSAKFLVTEIKIKKIIADCGCKSAEVSYHVMERIRKDTTYERVYGIINTMGPEKQTKAFMLSGDTINNTAKLHIELACKNPD